MQVIPKDHMSALPLYCPSSIANITSGAIQCGVPTNELAGLTIDAEPKSAVRHTFSNEIPRYERANETRQTKHRFKIQPTKCSNAKKS